MAVGGLSFWEALSTHQKDLSKRPLYYGERFCMRKAVARSISAVDYMQVQPLRRELAEAVSRVALKKQEMLLTASALSPDPLVAGCRPTGPPGPMHTQTMPFNVTGSSASSLPAGLPASGQLLAAQLVGRPFEEAFLLRADRAEEVISTG